MKVTLEFKLPEEEEMYRMIVTAPEILFRLRDTQERLRQLHKHGHSFNSADEAIATLYQSFCESFGEYLFS